MGCVAVSGAFEAAVELDVHRRVEFRVELVQAKCRHDTNQAEH
jgi:hypothetical protein